MDKPLLIGDVVRLIGRTAATLRRWEATGLLHPHRDHAGRRVYTPDDAIRARQLAGLPQEHLRPWKKWVCTKVDELAANLSDVDPGEREDVVQALLERVRERGE